MKNRLTRTRLAVLALSVPFGSVSWGQATLPEVVIVASRFEEAKLDVPVAVQILTQDDIQKSAAATVPDVLRMLGGVNVRSVVGGQLGGDSTIDLGGFGVTATQNTLILVDGRRLNPIDSSGIDWAAVPLSSIQRIEVASGGGGVQYGAGASGGVVNIITDGRMANRTQVGIRAGSFGTAQLNLNLDRQFNDVSVGLNATAEHSDGWRENSQVTGNSVSLKAQKELGADAYVFGELLVSHSVNAYPGGVLGQVGEGDVRAAKFNNVGTANAVDQQGLRLGGSGHVTGRTTMDVDFFVGKKKSNFTEPYNDTPDSLAGGWASTDGNSLDGEEVNFSPKLRTEFSNGGSLVYGLDLSQSRQSGASSYGTLAQQFILNNQGLFQGNLLSSQQSVQLLSRSAYVIARIPLNAMVEASIGARRQLQDFDTYDLSNLVGYPQSASGTFGANAYEAGLNFKFDAPSRAYLRANQSYRFANTDEYWGYDPVTYSRVFSGELRPQTTKAYELGYDYKDSSQAFSAVIAQSVTQGEIRLAPVSGNNTNAVDDIFRTSLALNWGMQMLTQSHLTVGVRFQRAEYSTGAYAGQTLGLVPTAIYNVGWIQDFENGSRAGLQVAHVSKQNYDASPAVAQTLDQMPAYTTADFFLSRTYGKLETKLTIKNLTGENTASYGGYGFVSMPAGTGKYSYYYYPSDPRSVYLSMNYQF
jgi:iron complex outermembrane recepter protein